MRNLAIDKIIDIDFVDKITNNFNKICLGSVYVEEKRKNSFLLFIKIVKNQSPIYAKGQIRLRSY